MGVRELPAAMVISLAAHAAAIAWMSLDPWPVRPPRLTPTAASQAPVAPMAIEMIDLPPPSGAVGTSGLHRATSDTARRVAIASAGGTTPGRAHENGAPGSAGAGGPTGEGLMKMRGNELPSTGLSDDFIGRFLEESPPVPPKDTEAEQIADDLANDRALLNDPRWVASASPAQLLAMREKLANDLDRRNHQELHPAGGGWFRSEHTVHDMTGLERESFGVDVAPDGTIKFHDASNLQAGGLAGSFDVSDWAVRRHGNDPYAHDKLVWLEKTRDDRVAIGKRHQRDVLEHTPQYVQQNLAWAWQRGRDVATRKRDLFELWDDCAESGDEALVAAGAAARAYVIGFIRARLPANSPDAYTSAELVELNAHRGSTHVFAPYAE
jgi:hypothetical protein